MTIPWWLLGAGAGIASALLLGVTPTNLLGAMLLSVLIPVPLFMAGLGLGTMAGAIAAAVATLVVLVNHGPMIGMRFAGEFAAPVAILVRQAMLSRTDDSGTEWFPAGLLTATLSVIGLGFAIAISAIISSLAVQELFDERLRIFAENFAAGNEGITADTLLEWMEPIKRLLPGMTTVIWMVNLIAAGALAQAALVKLDRNLRPWPNFMAMELPSWMVVVATVPLAAAMVLPEPARTYALAMTFAACFAFLLQGLAVVHAFNRKIQGGTILLVIFYVLVFGQGFPVVLLVLLGAVEQYAWVRRRWIEKTKE
ncbi:MAG: DUF2232 domain-containing protein [Proteobacteria bacterium]|nr:DUF2232 domain-containing protein [Pseudomonadota bacterium]